MNRSEVLSKHNLKEIDMENIVRKSDDLGIEFLTLESLNELVTLWIDNHGSESWHGKHKSYEDRTYCLSRGLYGSIRIQNMWINDEWVYEDRLDVSDESNLPEIQRFSFGWDSKFKRQFLKLEGVNYFERMYETSSIFRNVLLGMRSFAPGYGQIQ